MDVQNRVVVHGDSGQPVLLLPGGHASTQGFFPGLVEGLMLDPGCRVIVHDRPGTGRSTADGRFADAPDHLHGLIRAQGMGPVVIVGQSLGGALAAVHATRYPEDVAGLVLIDPTPVNDPGLAHQVERGSIAMERAAKIPGISPLLHRIMTSYAERSIARADMGRDAAATMRTIANEALDLVGMNAALRGFGEVSDRFQINRLPAVPAAVITADRKPRNRVRRAHEVLAAALDAELITWPGATHTAHLDDPDRTLEVVRSVLAQL